MIDILLIYPRLGSMDRMVTDLPLSLIYAAAESVKRGYQVKLVDLRIADTNWQTALCPYLAEGVVLAGISVMTGSPLQNAREVSEFIRREAPATKIVWGGPHATVLPETVREPFIDFLVRGYGSHALAELRAKLDGAIDGLMTVPGLSFKCGDEVVHNPREPRHEPIPFREIPYQLVEVNSPKYLRSYSQQRLFPVFTAIGCPYQCSFCVHPAIYREINGSKWLPLPDDEVIGHIEYAAGTFGASHFAIMDDTSFPDLERMRRLLQGIIDRGLAITLEFRGARVNEIERMDDTFLDLLVRAGTRVLMVGAESGSNRVLTAFTKGITREQILRSNRRLAKHSQLQPHYNFIYGTPGETYADLLATKDLILQLLRENRNAYIGFGSDWKPIPGTQTLTLAQQYPGFVTPQTLDDWIEVDSSDARLKIVHPWYERRQNNLIKLLQVTSFVIDDKLQKESAGNTALLFRLLRLLARLYKPIAMFRLRHACHQLLVEYEIWHWLVRCMSRGQSR